MNGIINCNIDILIMKYFNCSTSNKIRRAKNNHLSPEGTIESRVETILNIVFLYY